MPQYFQVLRCYKCLVFQVHQAKKSNKFECKMCGEKQSIKRHYGLGTGKECRLHVQKLNGIRENMDELNYSLSTDDDEEIKNSNQTTYQQDIVNAKKESKWTEYIEKTEINTNEPTNNDMHLDNTEEVLEAPSKKRKVKNTSNIRNKITASYTFDHNDEFLQKESIGNAIIDRKPNIISDNNIKSESGTAFTSKQTVRKKFIPPTCSKLSKWAHYIDETKSLEEGANSDVDLKREHISKDAFLDESKVSDEMTSDPQRKVIISNYSRWDFNTQTRNPYEKLCQSNSSLNRKSITKTQTQKLFSLCNDNDLDSILDI